jgi:hypothetical protein
MIKSVKILVILIPEALHRVFLIFFKSRSNLLSVLLFSPESQNIQNGRKIWDARPLILELG